MAKKRRLFHWNLETREGSTHKEASTPHPIFVFDQEPPCEIPVAYSRTYEGEHDRTNLSPHLLDLRSIKEQKKDTASPREGLSCNLVAFATPAQRFLRWRNVFPWRDLMVVEWCSSFLFLARSFFTSLSLSIPTARYAFRVLWIHFCSSCELIIHYASRLKPPLWARPFVSFVIGVVLVVLPFSVAIAYRDVTETRDRLQHLAEETVRVMGDAPDVSQRFDALRSGWTSFLQESENLKSRYGFFLPFVRLFPSYKQDIKTVEALLGEGKEVFRILEDVLGYRGWRRYLVIFQNNHELRATGGFMGSYAIVDVEDGTLKKLDVPPRGSYDLRGAMKVVTQAPEALQYVNPFFEFQDANWWPDWPTSAQKILWFWKNADQPTVDGVIAVNASVMEDFLRITGPVVLPEHGTMITSENFMRTIERAVEKEYDRVANTPKQFLGDFAGVFVPKLLHADRRMGEDMLRILERALAKKAIQVYLVRADLQSFVQSIGWDGGRTPFTHDGLLVTHTNIGGEKTDGIIEEEQQLDLLLNDDGSVDHTLTIVRRHRGKAGELFTGVPNLDYVRIAVPSGSTFLGMTGFATPESLRFREDPPAETPRDPTLLTIEQNIQVDPETGTRISEEQGRIIFANWLRVDPGKEQRLVFSYRVPKEQFHREPFFLLEHQSGHVPVPVHLSIRVPAALLWRPKNPLFQESLYDGGTMFSLDLILDEDIHLPLIQP